MDEALDSFTIYVETLRVALEDEVITDDESAMLKVVRRELGLKGEEHQRALKLVESSKDDAEQASTRPSHSEAEHLYEKVLFTALADDTISEDEWALLDILRITTAVSDTEHQAIASRVKTRFNEEGEEARLERMELSPEDEIENLLFEIG